MPDKITIMIHLFADDTKISLRLTNQNQWPPEWQTSGQTDGNSDLM